MDVADVVEGAESREVAVVRSSQSTHACLRRCFAHERVVGGHDLMLGTRVRVVATRIWLCSLRLSRHPVEPAVKTRAHMGLTCVIVRSLGQVGGGSQAAVLIPYVPFALPSAYLPCIELRQREASHRLGGPPILQNQTVVCGTGDAGNVAGIEESLLTQLGVW